MEKKLTSFDIARIAGVSQTSVSLVLRGKWKGRVGVETAEKIREVCNRYNYHVNFAASSLKTGKSRNISLVVPDSENPFFSHILHSLRIKSIPKGFECMLVETANSHTWYDYIEGSLLGGETSYAISLYNGLVEVGESIVDSVITVDDTPGKGTSIIIDFKGAISEAVRLFAMEGYDNIIYLHSAVNSDNGFREAIFRAECEKNKIAHSELLVTGHVQNNVYELLSSFSRWPGKKQALLLGDDLYAKGVYFFARDNKIEIGKDIGLISLNNTYICDCFTPPLTSFGCDTDVLVSTIMGMIEDGNEEKKTILLQMTANDNKSY